MLLRLRYYLFIIAVVTFGLSIDSNVLPMENFFEQTRLDPDHVPTYGTQDNYSIAANRNNWVDEDSWEPSSSGSNPPSTKSSPIKAKSNNTDKSINTKVHRNLFASNSDDHDEDAISIDINPEIDYADIPFGTVNINTISNLLTDLDLQESLSTRLNECSSNFNNKTWDASSITDLKKELQLLEKQSKKSKTVINSEIKKQLETLKESLEFVLKDYQLFESTDNNMLSVYQTESHVLLMLSDQINGLLSPSKSFAITDTCALVNYSHIEHPVWSKNSDNSPKIVGGHIPIDTTTYQSDGLDPNEATAINFTSTIQDNNNHVVGYWTCNPRSNDRQNIVAYYKVSTFFSKIELNEIGDLLAQAATCISKCEKNRLVDPITNCGNAYYRSNKLGNKSFFRIFSNASEDRIDPFIAITSAYPLCFLDTITVKYCKKTKVIKIYDRHSGEQFLDEETLRIPHYKARYRNKDQGIVNQYVEPVFCSEQICVHDYCQKIQKNLNEGWVFIMINLETSELDQDRCLLAIEDLAYVEVQFIDNDEDNCSFCPCFNSCSIF